MKTPYEHLSLNTRKALDHLASGSKENPIPYKQITDRYNRNAKKYLRSLREKGYEIIEVHGVGAYCEEPKS